MRNSSLSSSLFWPSSPATLPDLTAAPARLRYDDASATAFAAPAYSYASSQLTALCAFFALAVGSSHIN